MHYGLKLISDHTNMIHPSENISPITGKKDPERKGSYRIDLIYIHSKLSSEQTEIQQDYLTKNCQVDGGSLEAMLS